MSGVMMGHPRDSELAPAATAAVGLDDATKAAIRRKEAELIHVAADFGRIEQSVECTYSIDKHGRVEVLSVHAWTRTIDLEVEGSGPNLADATNNPPTPPEE